MIGTTITQGREAENIFFFKAFAAFLPVFRVWLTRHSILHLGVKSRQAATSGENRSDRQGMDQVGQTVDARDFAKALCVLWPMSGFQRPGQLMRHMDTPTPGGKHWQDV